MEFLIGTKKINLINHYFPSHSQNARDIHTKQINTKWIGQKNLIMTGDWNCVMDIQRDIYRTKESSRTIQNNHAHSIQEMQNFYDAYELVDKYIEAYETTNKDNPIYMTNRTQHKNGQDGTKQITLTRIDRVYVSNNLTPHIFNIIDYKEDATTPNYPPLPIQTSHLPIGIVVYDPNKTRMRQFKHIW